ncbi:MAG: hypothetical protein LQ347_000221 [Umbilicaria vellea]|nr:MAG: hypothetical protein LQ347_000221 [Umbilicaria vellea]
MDSDLSSPSEDMAALMGFFSFGAAPRTKKRKYNPAVENAVTDASLTLQEKNQQQQQHKDYRPSSGASGGNKVPLGKGRLMRKGETTVVVQPHGGMSNERTTARGLATGKAAERGDDVRTGCLEESDGACEDDGPRYVDESSTPPAKEGGVTALGTGGSGDNGARYVGTSRQPPLHGPGDVPLPAAEMTLNVDGVASEERGGGRDKAGVASGELYDWRALRQGVVNREGDVTYYDESFVENPWRELLVAAGRRGADGAGHG